MDVYYACKQTANKADQILLTWEAILQGHPEARPIIGKVARYVHAHNLCGYLQIGSYFDKIEGMQLLEFYGMCSREEVRLLLHCGEKRPQKMLLSWACKLVNHMQTAGYFTGSPDYTSVRQSLLDLCESLNNVEHIDNRPIPFAYSHLFNTLVHGYLLFVMYAAQFDTETHWLLRVIGYVFLCVVLLSLIHLAMAMARPIGRGPMKVDVIATCLHQFQEQMEFLQLNAKLPSTVEAMAAADTAVTRYVFTFLSL